MLLRWNANWRLDERVPEANLECQKVPGNICLKRYRGKRRAQIYG